MPFAVEMLLSPVALGQILSTIVRGKGTGMGSAGDELRLLAFIGTHAHLCWTG